MQFCLRKCHFRTLIANARQILMNVETSFIEIETRASRLHGGGIFLIDLYPLVVKLNKVDFPGRVELEIGFE